MSAVLDKTFVVSVMFRDRVGIVAEVSSIVERLGGNLADVSQTVMRGYFTMILMASFPAGVSEEDIRRQFADSALLAGAQIGVLSCAPEEAVPLDNAAVAVPENSAGRYVLTASGPDRPGLVRAFSSFLRQRSISIIDLTSVVARGEYTMVWLISLPSGTEVCRLQRELAEELNHLKMRIGLRHQAIFARTNEI